MENYLGFDDINSSSRNEVMSKEPNLAKLTKFSMLTMFSVAEH